ncbi:short-chain dehydrogenase/reductase [Kaistia sp. 32K]|uniref:SDR family oxidoreductase n=1 Tax=Kaistia sp. 32K TaxID=2795690 RepID=UPI00191522DC|nr:SDR family oxidoreductase [Kaistia sp. 32K]BCP56093.1 short-chain dehydrogenase/reductase [Kaistia sp. 32K]
MQKTMLITGSSSGVGAATAKYFAEHGFNVVATMRNPEAAQALEGIANLMVVRLDVEDTASIESALQATLDRFGRLDLLINNAGYGQYGVMEGMPIEKIRENFDVNVFGVINVMQRAVPILRRQGGGTILNVSSCGAIFGLPASAVYISTKWALEGFTESIAYELASQNIVTKIFEPGGILTPFHERSARDNTGNGHVPGYDAFLENTNNAMANLAEGAASPERVAADIYAAATDGTDRLRYCAPYGVEHLVKARRELDDPAYERFMRAQFPAAAR